MSQPILSILIATIPDRYSQSVALNEELEKQINACKQNVQVLILPGPTFLNGGPSIGKKRQQLVTGATGRYLCFLDDDDTISPDYIETLLRLCNEGKHVCSFRALYKLQTYWGVVNMSLANTENEQATPERMIQRPPWHICPVWSEFAKLYPFKDANYSEDFEWMKQVLTHCQSEAHTDRILFQYNHGPHSEADKITVSERP